MAWLLTTLPAWLTGRIEPRARREVRSWTKDNATLRTLQYGRFRRLLMWSADHPVVFALLAGVVSAGIAYLTAVQEWTAPWKLTAPKLKEGFDLAEFTGVPWSVQATLVALVYPIVLSFVALMLQRKAHSTVVLRVYVLDSAVVPAGASSMGLLVAMGIQYFATPYSTSTFLSEYMASLLTMNGAWLLINVLLTGFFLSRTIRFIQEEEQRHAFTRVAVDVVLRSELTSSVKQHIFVNAPQSDWRFPEVNENEGPEPRVHMFELRAGRPEVRRDLKGSLMLHDVHLRLLHLVVSSWSRRAAKLCAIAKAKTPTLIFPPRIGEVMSGEVILCAVENGPILNRLERLLVRTAFVYRPSRQGTLSLSTRRMLEEIGGEVEAAAEQQRFGAAEERLRDVIRLHKTLLLASAADSEGVAGNAATIGTSPYSWGSSSFDMEWLKPYRDVGRIAVNRLIEDTRLFRTLAMVPASIARELPPRPEKLLIDAQLVGTSLANQLAGWWAHKADASSLPGEMTFTGSLPAPLSKAYEQALLALIGGWGQFQVSAPEGLTGGDVHVWQAITGRALVYAKHIENSAQLFLKAVSRGDEIGSIWLLDNLLKWWGNRHYELACTDVEDDFRVRHVTMTLAVRDWAAAQEFLWDGYEPITVEFAKKAISLAIRRYWESMRLYVVLVLIQNAGSSPTSGSRELRLAAALIRGTAQRAGGAVDARPLDTLDAVLRSILGNVFGVETAVGRIDEFAEKLRWDDQTPEVSGWIYSWSGTPTGLESLKRAQAVLLVALAAARRTSITRSKELIERWWKDIDKLEQVQRYCADLQMDLRSDAFNDTQAAVSCLQELLDTSHRFRFGRLALTIALKKLQIVAQHERQITLRALSVDATKVRNLSNRIASHAFGATGLPPPICTLDFVPGLAVPHMSVVFTDEKKRYLENVDEDSDSGIAEDMGDRARQHMFGWSFAKLVADTELKPMNDPSLREMREIPHTVMQAYLSAVAAQCSALEANGKEPVVLVGRSAARRLLSKHRWGSEVWQCPLPKGVVVNAGAAVDGVRMVSLINGVPVFEFETPDGDCYVLPAAMLKTLGVTGSDANNALTLKWSAEGDDQLKFSMNWRAGFLRTAD